MTIEYMTDTGRLQIEHVDKSEVRRWAAEHPFAIILHAVPDGPPGRLTPASYGTG